MSKIAALFASLSLLMSACSGFSGDIFSKDQEPRVVTEDAKRLATASNQFGFDLFRKLTAEGKGNNIFFSPLSISLALEMTGNGASGKTLEEMSRTLHLGQMTTDEVNKSALALMKSIKSADPKIELAMANSLWARQGVEFKKDFLARNKNNFQAEMTSLNFNDPQAKATINNWVSRSTRGKIPTIIDTIDNQMVLYLINAIYFKGQWKDTFDKSSTETAPFHLASGSEKPVPMMNRSGSYSYIRGDRFQAVGLPYGKGDFSMLIFLPDSGYPLKDFLRSFNHEKWERLMTGFRNNPGTVRIPRFKLSFEKELSGILKSLGMTTAFDAGTADFSKMLDQSNVLISEVKHKAIVEVNEEGTVAAAATSVGIRLTSAIIDEPFNFVADHPFVIAIRDQRSGAILFMGIVENPS
ncbi:MAG: serpin family protein [Acidobacteria bacterium]|nr:serpin family protein [Acidobacteriota bacterium]